jgi:hypothetical protein
MFAGLRRLCLDENNFLQTLELRLRFSVIEVHNNEETKMTHSTLSIGLIKQLNDLLYSSNKKIAALEEENRAYRSVIAGKGCAEDILKVAELIKQNSVLTVTEK